MKIGIITICLGKYDIFFEGLYNSFEKKFLPNHIKTFFVFNDTTLKERDNVKSIPYEKMGWPFDTLNRFDMFLKIKNDLLQYDFIYFLNANMICEDFVYDEILPNHKNHNLVGVNHPGFYNKRNIEFPYERNKNSEFFIGNDEGKFYFQGCFNGGGSQEFLDMSDILSFKIKKDLKNNIMPIWHDESALNWYLKDKNPLILSPSYSYPENWNLPFDKKILQLDKQKFGGHNYLRTN